MLSCHMIHRLIKAVNGRFEEWGVHVQYGTMDDYFKLVDIKQDWCVGVE